MIRLFHGNKPVVRAIEVSIGVFTPDTIFSIGNERETRKTRRRHCDGGKLRIDVEMRHDGATLSEEIR